MKTMAQIKSGMVDPKVKLLRYMDRIQGVMEGNFKAPIMADVDVVQGVCNLDCEWCCQRRSREEKSSLFMKKETMERMGPFCKEWGVKSWRIAGDSEPTLNKDLSVLLQSGHDNGIDMGLITNGTLLQNIKNLQYLTWIGVSLDASTPEIWCKLKHSPEKFFWQIIDNIKMIRKEYPHIDVTLKFIKFSASGDMGRKEQFAKKMFAELENVDNHKDAELLPALADDLGVNYHIIDAFKKNPKYKFDVCRATPLYGTFGADHKFYICCDRRYGPILTMDYTKDNWNELLRLWGSDEHKKIIDAIRPPSCAFCSKAWLNTVMENVMLDGKHSKEYQVNFI